MNARANLFALIALLALLLVPVSASASGPGSLWDMTPAPDRQNGGFWALAQHWHPDDGVELVLLQFDHEGAQQGDAAHVAPGETWRTGIATAPGGEILIVWWDSASDRFQTRWGDVGGNLAAPTTIEANSGWGRPGIDVDPLTNEFVVVWNAQTAGWQTWAQRISNTSGAHNGAPAAVYSGWGGVEPNDARFAFDGDGNGLLLTSAGAGIYTTHFGPGMAGDSSGPRQVVNSGLAPGTPELAYDKNAGMWVAVWKGWSGPSHILAAWLDTTGAATQVTLDQGNDGRGNPHPVAGFDRTWISWWVTAGASVRVDGVTTTGPGDFSAIESWAAASTDQVSTPRVAYNPICPNLTLFLTRHLALDEPELVSLEREDPCPPEADDDDATDDDDSAATDDDDDDGDDDDDDDDDGGRDRGTCGAASTSGACAVGPAAAVMLVLFGVVGLVRRR